MVSGFRRTHTVFMVLALVLVVSGCATRTVTRTGLDEQIDLSGRWNDTDSRIVAQDMVDDVLSRPWLQNFVQTESRAPVVLVGDIRNRSSEHIETDIFIRNIERELINSGQIRFVAGDAARETIRSERLDQQTQARPETVARLGAETGADYMMYGAINSVTDAVEGERVITYQVDLQLVDMQSNEIVWLNTIEIRKRITQPRARW
ncbi:MAG: penicillin-binding protein activator LpoB [Spirochaetaceae bacterium]